MLGKKTVLLGFACILFTLCANASTIQLVEPITGSITELATQTNQPISFGITIKNIGTTTTQGIQFTSDLNATFNPNGFGLDANQQKTAMATITATETAKGTISIDGQSFTVKIVVSETPTWWQQALQKIEENQTILFLGLFAVCFALIVFTLRKVK